MCRGWNTESDNNTQFQLNSLMCDLYLRNCFLLLSEVFRTLQHLSAFMQTPRGLCETLVCSQIWNYWATEDMACCVHDLFASCVLMALEKWVDYFTLLLLCCGKQTWRTSRPREEVQWGFVKVKEWSYCAAHHPTLEVRWMISFAAMCSRVAAIHLFKD